VKKLFTGCHSQRFFPSDFWRLDFFDLRMSSMECLTPVAQELYNSVPWLWRTRRVFKFWKSPTSYYLHLVQLGNQHQIGTSQPRDGNHHAVKSLVPATQNSVVSPCQWLSLRTCGPPLEACAVRVRTHTPEHRTRVGEQRTRWLVTVAGKVGVRASD
jgi:hypothetical protein